MKKRDDIYISQILERISLIKKHLKGVSREKFVKSALHKSAVIRELEVIGEAARLVSAEVKASHPFLPWQEMMGMRNRLIHEYFNVDESIVWEVASVQLPHLEKDFEKAFLHTSSPIHPWRNCPIGYYFVNTFPRLTPSGGSTDVRQHCRKNPNGKDQLYPQEIIEIAQLAKSQQFEPLAKMDKPNNANEFDQIIVFGPNTGTISSIRKLHSPLILLNLYFLANPLSISMLKINVFQIETSREAHYKLRTKHEKFWLMRKVS